MSIQIQPRQQQQQQQQQPVVVYPNTTVTMQPPPSPPHSNGSFGIVLVILTVIVVISAVACCLGRFCKRGRENKRRPSNQSRKNHNFRPWEREREERDIEFGFEKGFPSGRPAGHGDPRSHKLPSENGPHVKGEAKSIEDIGEPMGWPTRIRKKLPAEARLNSSARMYNYNK